MAPAARAAPPGPGHLREHPAADPSRCTPRRPTPQTGSQAVSTSHPAALRPAAVARAVPPSVPSVRARWTAAATSQRVLTTDARGQLGHALEAPRRRPRHRDVPRGRPRGPARDGRATRHDTTPTTGGVSPGGDAAPAPGRGPRPRASPPRGRAPYRPRGPTPSCPQPARSTLATPRDVDRPATTTRDRTAAHGADRPERSPVPHGAGLARATQCQSREPSSPPSCSSSTTSSCASSSPTLDQEPALELVAVAGDGTRWWIGLTDAGGGHGRQHPGPRRRRGHPSALPRAGGGPGGDPELSCSRRLVRLAFAADACGYLVKYRSHHQLVDAIRSAAARGSPLAAPLVRRLVSE